MESFSDIVAKAFPELEYDRIYYVNRLSGVSIYNNLIRMSNGPFQESVLITPSNILLTDNLILYNPCLFVSFDDESRCLSLIRDVDINFYITKINGFLASAGYSRFYDKDIENIISDKDFEKSSFCIDANWIKLEIPNTTPQYHCCCKIVRKV